MNNNGSISWKHHTTLTRSWFLPSGSSWPSGSNWRSRRAGKKRPSWKRCKQMLLLCVCMKLNVMQKKCIYGILVVDVYMWSVGSDKGLT